MCDSSVRIRSAKLICFMKRAVEGRSVKADIVFPGYEVAICLNVRKQTCEGYHTLLRVVEPGVGESAKGHNLRCHKASVDKIQQIGVEPLLG